MKWDVTENGGDEHDHKSTVVHRCRGPLAECAKRVNAGQVNAPSVFVCRKLIV
jgi:hypothetical protein